MNLGRATTICSASLVLITSALFSNFCADASSPDTHQQPTMKAAGGVCAKTARRAIVAGSTGGVGVHIVRVLAADPSFEVVTALVRPGKTGLDARTTFGIQDENQASKIRFAEVDYWGLPEVVVRFFFAGGWCFQMDTLDDLQTRSPCFKQNECVLQSDVWGPFVVV